MADSSMATTSNESVSSPLPMDGDERRSTAVDNTIRMFGTPGVAPPAISQCAQDLTAAAPAIMDAARSRTAARREELHRVAKNSTDWMVPAPLVKEAAPKRRRKRKDRQPKKMTAGEWQRQHVVPTAAEKAAATAKRNAALEKVQKLDRIPVCVRVYAMKQFELLPKYFKCHAVMLRAFWHKINFPKTSYGELLQLYPACSMRQHLQQHLDRIIVAYQHTAMFMQEQRLTDEVVRELGTITPAEHDKLHLRIMKDMSSRLRAAQDAMHAEYGPGKCWKKGEGAAAMIKDYTKQYPLWKGCGKTLLNTWAREYPGVGPAPPEALKVVSNNRCIFTIQEENELCEAVLQATAAGRSMQVGSLAQKLQQVINGTTRQAKFKNGVVSKQFARALMGRWRARKAADTTTPVRDNHDRISWCTYENFDHLYLDILEDAIKLKLGYRTNVSLDIPNGEIFVWTEKDRIGLADETDFPLAEREAKGAAAKVIVPYDMGDIKNKERRVAGIHEKLTRKSINKGGTKTSLMAGATLLGERYPPMVIAKAERMPRDEICEKSGVKFNPWSHSLNIAKSTEELPVYEIDTTRVNGQTLEAVFIANKKGGMTASAYHTWITRCVIPSHPSLHAYLDFDEGTGCWDLKDKTKKVPYDDMAYLMVDGDYSHINNDESHTTSLTNIADHLVDEDSALALLPSKELGCLDYISRCGIFVRCICPYSSSRTQKDDSRKGNNQALKSTFLPRAIGARMDVLASYGITRELDRTDIPFIIMETYHKAWSEKINRRALFEVGLDPFTRSPFWATDIQATKGSDTSIKCKQLDLTKINLLLDQGKVDEASNEIVRELAGSRWGTGKMIRFSVSGKSFRRIAKLQAYQTRKKKEDEAKRSVAHKASVVENNKKKVEKAATILKNKAAAAKKKEEKEAAAAVLAIKKEEEKKKRDLARKEKEKTLPLAKRVKAVTISAVGNMTEEQLQQLEAFVQNMSK
jgi:hypothetical protein